MNIVEVIESGESPPYGLSKKAGSALKLLRLPLFPWYGRAYQINMDAFVTGWHMRDVYIRFGTTNKVLRADKVTSGFEVA
jgi:hypothetical protein